VDEKSQIQALDRTQPGLPLKKGRSGTMTHGYKRNGATTLFAALMIAAGRVNCASIPKDLFESEFSGHTRGAFTGAVKDRAGRFEAAEGGTLFLDEIGEVPLDLQSQLLRVLQEKSYERAGEDRTRQADVRVIAATNRNLEQAVAAGRLREDLYYRLNVFPIQVPPLRERMEDVAPLAKHFIESSVRELGCPQPRLTRAAIAKLENYHWPGNIRELRNVIERALIISRGGALDFDLPVTESAIVPSRPAAHAKSDAEPEFLTEAEPNCNAASAKT
jgi:transcriptional regulator with GAF, ATPase, and Fis domain